ncbi:uncharacterized protein LOC122081170 [Macadamia integrifolia]|uniref:uncharacterized protein LOC122081170 n=1 Tax=Macadamia integrifolia TaxID=60698 RepID=UPI001C4F48CD|nr:uncharacterized protein LOC122081170 [Macadamia integrifolia]
MARKHLHELLVEDQEPFILQNYIEERRCQLKKWVPRGHLQVKRRKPISENSSFPASFCRNACLFSFHDSPDLRKSPLFDFSSPLKSPCRNSNSLFIHIPSRTAALLVEAAVRIQKQPSSTKTTGKTLGSGFFGSILKRINLRKRNRKPQIKGNEMRVSVKDILRWDSSNGRKAFPMGRRQDREEKMVALDGNRVGSEKGLSCSSNSTLSSVWSESNEDKSEDLETSSSNRSDEDSEEIEFLVNERNNGDYGSCDKAFCSSPFRFALQKSPSPGRRTPEFGSPARSPRRRVKEREEGGLNCLGNKDHAGEEEEEEEEKEQCSPVSVLDPPFDTDIDDDDDKDCDNSSDDGDHRHYQLDYDCEEGGEKDDDDQLELEEDEQSYELHHSFAIVKRAKQKLLHKLRRFERLADLNPIELEKRMLEMDNDDEEEEECDENYVSQDEDESFVETLYSQFQLCNKEGKGKKTPGDMKQLILDLIGEEGRRYDDEHEDGVDMEAMVKNVSKRLGSWKGVESDTIDMMVDLDLKREGDEWRRDKEQVKEMAIEIELTIFGLLVQELSDELVQS